MPGSRQGKVEMQMGDYIVYADVLFGINFFLDFILLWGTAKFGNFPSRMRRLIAGGSGARMGSRYLGEAPTGYRLLTGQ